MKGHDKSGPFLVYLFLFAACALSEFVKESAFGMAASARGLLNAATGRHVYVAFSNASHIWSPAHSASSHKEGCFPANIRCDSVGRPVCFVSFGSPPVGYTHVAGAGGISDHFFLILSTLICRCYDLCIYHVNFTVTCTAWVYAAYLPSNTRGL